jgi:hypothetical protein
VERQEERSRARRADLQQAAPRHPDHGYPLLCTAPAGSSAPP